jgi:tRNA (cmo5U34)-methyltransferase
MSTSDANKPTWTENLSCTFIDYGRYFVPRRDEQMRVIAGLLALDGPSTILELCCGEGLLAERLLDQYPAATLYGFDGSAEMLNRAKERLARFESRSQSKLFDLAATDWREPGFPVQAVVSSLAIHHLTGDEKQALFADVYRLLSEGGVFVIADLVEHDSTAGRRAAAEQWDAIVRQQAIDPDGNEQAFEFFQREGWNSFRSTEPDDIDHPSPLLAQLHWLKEHGYVDVDVYWMLAGHAIFAGWKSARVNPR